MKTSGWLVCAAMAGALAMQGCAQTGRTRVEGSQPPPPPPSAATAAPAQSAVAIPENDAGKPVVAADTKDHFDAVAAAIRQQMQTGGRFAFVDSRGRSEVNARLDDMSTLFNQYGTVGTMSSSAKSQLLDDQTAINEVLARYDSNRLICHDEVPVGSHLPKRICRTLGQIQQEQNNANQLMNRMHGVGSSNTMNGGH